MARQSHHPRHHARAARVAACWALVTTAGRAEGPLEEGHDGGYYLARGGAVAAAIGLTFATTAALDPARPAPAPAEWLGWDDPVRGRLSTAASAASDVTLLTTMVLPIGMELTQGVDPRLANTSIIYGEVLGANVLLSMVVKYSLPRLRPYNYRVPPATAYVESQGVDAYLSFYSGHASSAFAAAIGGSYLFAAAHPDAMTKTWLWGAESALAAATAVWRVRAGKHFYSDVAVGIAVGSAIGLTIPLAEGVRYRPSAAEMVFAGGGLIVGGVAAALAPFDAEIVAPLGANARVRILPALGHRSAGLSAVGSF